MADFYTNPASNGYNFTPSYSYNSQQQPYFSPNNFNAMNYNPNAMNFSNPVYDPYAQTQEKLQNLQRQVQQPMQQAFQTMPQQQPIQQQPAQIQPQEIQSKIIMVSSIDEAKNQPIFDNSLYIFANNQTGEIIGTRQLNINTGSSPFYEYKRVIEDSENTINPESLNENNKENVNQSEINKLWDEIKELKGVISNVQSNGNGTNVSTNKSASETDVAASSTDGTVRNKPKSNNRKSAPTESKQSDATSN